MGDSLLKKSTCPKCQDWFKPQSKQTRLCDNCCSPYKEYKRVWQYNKRHKLPPPQLPKYDQWLTTERTGKVDHRGQWHTGKHCAQCGSEIRVGGDRHNL